MRFHIPLALTAILAFSACSSGRSAYPHAETGLDLTTVVLYRNGVGYFERQGRVDGDILRIRVRKDHINDLLKSLTVVKRNTGQALSVSMPLDPQSWANAALSTLTPGSGSLAEVLDALRGTHVTLRAKTGNASGRVLMVETIEEPSTGSNDDRQPPKTDHRVTLLDNNTMRVVMLSNVTGIKLEDGDLAMQFHRSLDATAGEGMFQQVDVAIRLTGASSHDVVVSYVAPAPMWKPTYRVVLPEKGKGKALLQGWAVVDNTSGEDWNNVRLSLTSGAPIAFRYDLHTPRTVDRSDLTESGVSRRARVAVGETNFDSYEQKPMPPREEYAADYGGDDLDECAYGCGVAVEASKAQSAPSRTRGPAAPAPTGYPGYGAGNLSGSGRMGAAKPDAAPTISVDSLRESTLAQTRASSVSGLTRFDITNPMTVPDGSSTMVAIINESVDAEETFMFRPGGAGTGYESNPYRVVRFQNSSPFILEPGPISIYAGGSFIGEGISEAVGAGSSATIPFAVEPTIMVSSSVQRDGDEMRLIRINRGVLEVERFARTTTSWSVKSQTRNDGYTVLIRHPKEGNSFELVNRPKDTVDVANGYLIPIPVAAGKREASIKVVEQSPSKTSISIWDGRSLRILETLLVARDLTAAERTKLEPIVTLRQEIGRIDTEISGLLEQTETLNQRAAETRRSLLAIAKDPRAAALRQKLNKRLDEFTSEADKLGRTIIELRSRRLEKQIELEDMLQNLDFSRK